MLGTWRPHAKFQDFLVQHLAPRWTSDRSRIEHHQDLLDAAWLFNLDPALPILAPHYAARGRRSHQAPALLRSLLLMTHAGQPSISKWHKQLLGEPILAIACGFLPGQVPGIGTFYDFCDRLWPDETGPVIRSVRRKQSKKPQKGEKLATEKPGVVNRLFAKASQGRRFTRQPGRFIQQLFARVVVDKSARMGLLGNTEKLAIAIDGAPLQTGASYWGRKVCTCQNRYCGCPRRYQDRWANRGWDSAHGHYFYGHTLYHGTAADSPYDLPLYLRVVQASRNDGVTGFVALVEMLDLFPGLRITKLLADAAHDNVATYSFCYDCHIAPYIDENKRSSKYSPPIGQAPDGAPICPAGEIMRSNGFNPGRKRHKWICSRECGECVCSPSAYGRVVYTYPQGSLREPPVPRNSKAWHKVYKRRTSVERSLKRSLVDRNLEHCRVRRTHHWVWRATLTAMAQHVDAWINEQRKRDGQPLAWLKAALQAAA